MRTNIKSTGLSVTQEIQAYLDKKRGAFEKLVDPKDTTALCDIELELTTKHHQSGKIFRAEINLKTADGSFRVESRQNTLFAAIDKVKDEIMKELRRNKDKKQRLMKDGGARVKAFLKRFRG